MVFEITKHIADIGNKELNVVSWNNRTPKIDLRSWRTTDSGEKIPNRGITLTEAEAQELADALNQYGKA